MELTDTTGKAPATPGTDPGTFRLVAQCLNHCATPGPNPYSNRRVVVVVVVVVVIVIIIIIIIIIIYF
jgi:hypothetical protein